MPTEELAEVQRLAGRLSGVVQVQAIILRELAWTMPELNVPSGLPIDLRPEFDAQAATVPQLLIYKIQTDVSGIVQDEVEIFHLKAVYQLAYSFPEGMDFIRAEVEAFGATTAMLMMFPYLRETLQTTAAKAGLPGILLPPLRMPITPLGETTQKLSESEEQAPPEA